MDFLQMNGCDYCNDGTERVLEDNEREFGCPKRLCPRCGKAYYDGGFQEAAIYLYTAEAPLPEFYKWLAASIFMIGLDLFAAFKLWSNLNAVTIFVFVAATAMVFVRMIRGLHARLHKEEYQRKFHQENLKALQGVKKPSDALAASLERMRSEEYLYYLISHGVEVPDYFFHSIDCVPDISRTTEMKELCKVYTKERKRRERVHELRRRAEYYGEALALGEDSIIFRQQAQSKGMSPEAFEEHCRRMLDECREEIKNIENA